MKKIILFVILAVNLLSCKNEEKKEESKETANLKKENVLVKIVNKENLKQTIELSGVLEPVQDAWIFAKINGEVLNLEKQLGDFVQEGEKIGRIDDDILQTQLLQSQAAVQAADAALKIAQMNFEASKVLYADKTISKLEYDQAEIEVISSKAQLDGASAQEKQMEELLENAYLSAPFSGHIAEINIREGDYISQGTPLCRIVNNSKNRVKTTISLNDKKKLSKDVYATIKNTETKLDFIGIGNAPLLNTSHFSIEFELKKQANFNTGETIFIRVSGKELNDKIAIPDNAISKEYDQNYVFIVVQNIAKRKDIVIEKYIGSSAIIQNGLRIGDKVIVDGVENIKDGSFVTIKNQE